MRSFHHIAIAALLIPFLGGCSTKPDTQYWQRMNPSSALYMRGAKAQDILFRDIRNCTNELDELERLREVDDPVPTTLLGRIIPNDQTNNDDIKSIDNQVFALGKNYRNFDDCMYAKGWERTNHLPASIDDTIHLEPRRTPPSRSQILQQMKQNNEPPKTPTGYNDQ